MGKKGKGKKGKKGAKGKGSKKKDKKQEDKEPPAPPELNVFVYFRRKNLTLALETYAEETIKDLKIQVATIIRQFAEDITLFSMLGKEPEEMEEIAKPDEDKKKQEGSRGRGKDAKKEKTERRESPPKGPVHKTLSSYGYNSTTANLFMPAVIGISYRGDDGTEFEKLDITPYSQFPVIPEEIKMHLRNYVPPPPPPAPKKKGGGGGGKSTTKVQQQ